MAEFNIKKIIRFVIVAFIFISILRACTFTTLGGGYGSGMYYGSPMGGGGGFFSGLLLGNMLGGGSIFGGGNRSGAPYSGGRNVRRGTRGGGFGFGK